MKKIETIAPNQYYFCEGNKIVFQSYETIVCTITNGKVKITQGQPQSKTTAKYLNQFLQIHTKYKSYKEII